MQELDEIQSLLIGYFKYLKLDEAAIMFIMLTLKSEATQGAMLLYLRDNPNPTQEELMQAAVDFLEISEELGLEDAEE